MNLSQQVDRYFSETRARLKIGYEDLGELGFDAGFAEYDEDGVERQLLTRDISTSAQRYGNTHVEVALFSGSSLVVLEFPTEVDRLLACDFLQVRYVISGTLVLEFNGRREEFSRGEVCLINLRTPYRELRRESRATTLNVCVHPVVLDEGFLGAVSLTPLQSYLRSRVINDGQQLPFLRFVPRAEGVRIQRTEQEEFSRLHPEESIGRNPLEEALSFLFGEDHYKAAGYEHVMRGQLLRLFDRLATVCRLDGVVGERDAYDRALFESVSLYMRNNLASVTLGDLAQEFHYHPNYFNGLVRRHSGVTFSAFLVSLRIAKAKELLRATDMPVDLICQAVGYNNRGFLYRKFTEETGMTPAAYRRRNR
ncbi:MAG: helix-turn-helix domain-containing protein [Atopobiaceae bacterium]|nr:helix-turn-helix domain-containing protein [Atopobiaceae bacterium]MBR1830460.1 helix-turn-helix domain-containing protein [Atopobiaceae bacterium]